MIDEEVLNQFKCSGCGECCRWTGFVLLTPKDLPILAAQLNLSELDFIDQHTRLSSNRQQLALLDKSDGSCAFLKGDRCSIYAARPEQCRTFPFVWSVQEGCPELDKLVAAKKSIEKPERNA